MSADTLLKLQKLTKKRQKKILSRLKKRITDIHIGFEDIYDPHNVMAATRTIDAFGFQFVHLIFEEQEPFNPKKIGKKTSASANRWITFIKHSSTLEAINYFRSNNFTIIATVVDEDAVKLNHFRWRQIKKPFVILFGNEHRGLSQKMIENSDYKLYIPMRGFVESLNLSVSVGIILWDLIVKTNLIEYTDKTISTLKEDILNRWLSK